MIPKENYPDGIPQLCDEAPMANKAVIACVDERCWRVMCADELFGGKVMILSWRLSTDMSHDQKWIESAGN